MMMDDDSNVISKPAVIMPETMNIMDEDQNNINNNNGMVTSEIRINLKKKAPKSSTVIPSEKPAIDNSLNPQANRNMKLMMKKMKREEKKLRKYNDLDNSYGSNLMQDEDEEMGNDNVDDGDIDLDELNQWGDGLGSIPN